MSSARAKRRATQSVGERAARPMGAPPTVRTGSIATREEGVAAVAVGGTERGDRLGERDDVSTAAERSEARSAASRSQRGTGGPSSSRRVAPTTPSLSGLSGPPVQFSRSRKPPSSRLGGARCAPHSVAVLASPTVAESTAPFSPTRNRTATALQPHHTLPSRFARLRLTHPSREVVTTRRRDCTRQSPKFRPNHYDQIPKGLETAERARRQNPKRGR